MTFIGELRFINKLLAYLLFQITKLVPRKSDKWVFGAHFGFSENSKYLFYEINERHYSIRAIWIANNREDVVRLRNQGLEAYHWKTLKGLWHTITSRVFVINSDVSDINRCLAGGAFVLNLWHGVGLKKVRWLAKDYYSRKYNVSDSSFRFKIETFFWLFCKTDLCLVPSLAQAKIFFIPMLNTTCDHILLGGYPRNRLLMSKKCDVENYVKTHESGETLMLVRSLQKYSHVYIYMPTWRNDSHDFVGSAKIDWYKLNEGLRERNAILLLKLHPHTRLDLSVIYTYSNIKNYPPQCDVYAVMPFTDTLITDYSSIYSDYSLMDKEIILFVYDYDQYVKGSYELKDYDKYYPGVRAHSFEELLVIIKEGRDCHVPKAERDFVMQFYWDSIDNRVDIVEEVKKRLN
ncbi:MAG: CDP-glycerol glycerophosphotransferase family protein [Prevotella sp.]|nr:CDP-glycerol glycerophosphotransferase family protein [Prevotella sp.]